MKRLLLSILLLSVSGAQAADALVKLVIGKASAPARTSLPKGSTFSTAAKSRSELTLTNGLMRAGADTSVQIAGEDALTLNKGTVLVAAKPRFFRSSLSVKSHGYGLKVRGTAQVFSDPGRSIRVVVMEGEVTVSLDSLVGEKITLKPGQELIINPTDHRLPQPIEIDLGRLMATTQMIGNTFDELPTHELLQSSTHTQEREMKGETLDSTELVMEGGSSDLYVRCEELVHEEVSDELDDLDGDGEPDPEVDPEDPEADPNDAAVDDNTDNVDDTTGDQADDSAPPPPSGSGKTSRRGKARTTLTTKPKVIAGKQNLSRAQISRDQIQLGSSTVKTDIKITNSSQIAALAGHLQALSKGGSIVVDASTLKASDSIILDTSGDTSGLISLKNATLNASVIKARAFGPSGDSLIIDGSTLNASQLIRLEAAGASTLRFCNNVNLNTPQAVLSGHAVQVDGGGNVRVTGKADIYTDDARYNRTGYGTLSASGGATTHSR